MTALQATLQAGEPRAAAERIRLFLDDFESYGGNKALLRHGGWVALQRSADKGGSAASGPLNRLLSEYWAPRSGKDEKGDFAVDEEDSVSGLRSLRMEKAENGPTVMTKIFSLPFRAPFAVSERPFAVVDREADAGPVRRQDRGSLRRSGDLARASGEAATPLNPGIKVAGPEGAGGGEMGVLSVSPTGTYYIYAFDGRMLAEYNGLGICVRDYIYMGGKLIAEYRPQENSYFYYATDQIGSTRIVTDDTGAVVYAAAHDPYGGIQQTWTSAYDPALKFSGKERDTESGLDYFGARYYDYSLYRFLSVDPVIPAGRVVFNPQRWNLYAYCLNNPNKYVDQTGAYPVLIEVVRQSYHRSGYILGELFVNGVQLGYTRELRWRNNQTDISCIPVGEYEGYIGLFTPEKGNPFNTVRLTNASTDPRTLIAFHQGDNTKGCILIGLSRNNTTGMVTGGAVQALLDRINFLGEVERIERSLFLSELPYGISDVFLGFFDLPSMADYPEITVVVSMSMSFLMTSILTSLAFVL